MKKVFLSLVLVCGVYLSYSQNEVKSKLEKVTIYPNKALVEKSVKVNLVKGDNKFIITQNATNVTSNAIHFSSSEDWFITSQNTQIQNLPEKEAAKKSLPQNVYSQYLVLKDKLDNLNAQITDNESLIGTITYQKTALNNLKAVKNTQEIDTISTIKTQFSFQRDEIKNLNKLYNDAVAKSTELYYQKNSTLREIESLIKKYVGGKKILTNENSILVSIYSNKNLQNETLTYSYTVYGVGSRYFYDVMLDEQTHKAVFSLKNSVYQNTGENWKDCEIVFSTSEGEYAGFDAELQPYYLDYNETKPQVKYRTYQNNVVMAKTARAESTMTMEDVATYDANYLSGSSVMQNLSLNKEYTLSTPQSIATNEDVLTIPLYNEQTKAYFSRFSTPKNEEKVFYTALLPDWEDLGLLDSECDVYLNNRFISKSYINTSGISDTMRFSVGDDKNIKVTRKLRKTSPTEKGFLSKDIIETATITITIKNTKNESVELSLKDQIPISSNSEIKITDMDLASGDLNANTGVVRWNVNLAPKEEKKIVFSYTVKYPKGHKVTLY
ncbi:MAG: DUF4139 domain-containing protein [Bacteroidales bacterium]|nr:DUF4139 domain-containing protein [Bacteroidales bacterium]